MLVRIPIPTGSLITEGSYSIDFDTSSVPNFLLPQSVSLPDVNDLGNGWFLTFTRWDFSDATKTAEIDFTISRSSTSNPFQPVIRPSQGGYVTTGLDDAVPLAAVVSSFVGHLGLGVLALKITSFYKDYTASDIAKSPAVIGVVAVVLLVIVVYILARRKRKR